MSNEIPFCPENPQIKLAQFLMYDPRHKSCLGNESPKTLKNKRYISITLCYL